VKGGPRQVAQGVAIAPDGDSVAFTWQALDGTYELRTLTVANRVARLILRDSEITYLVPHAFTRDSSWILTTAYRHNGREQLLLVSTLDGRRVLVQDLGGREHPRYVSLSPDDRFVVYDGPGAGESKTRDIFISRTDGTGRRRLITDPANDGNATWTPDGRFVLFTSDRAGTMDLWRVAVMEGNVSAAPERTYRDIGRILPVGITNEGRLVYERITGATDVYQAPLTGSDAARPSTLTSNHVGQNISSLWSPDGRSVAFTSRRGLLALTPHSTTLVVRDLQSGRETEFDPPMNQFLVRAWSPDGRRLLIAGQGSDGIQGARIFDLSSGVTTLVAPGGTFGRPDWLPDGRIIWLERSTKRIVRHDVEANQDEVLFDLSHQPGNLIADVLGRGFRISPDGQSLAFTTRVSEDAKPVYRLAVFHNGVTRVVYRDTEPLRLQDWLPDASAILFTRWKNSAADGPISLWRVDVDGGREEPLHLSAVGLRDVSVSPDGARITFTVGWPVSEGLSLHVGRPR
jgi:Tol biopolymer transport system component